jgi:hypothetical protein
VLEPEQADIAFDSSLEARGPGKVAEQCRAVVFPVALLDAEAVGQKSVAARSVGHEPGLPSLLRPFSSRAVLWRRQDGNRHQSRQPSIVFAPLRAAFGTGSDELRAAHLIGKRKDGSHAFTKSTWTGAVPWFTNSAFSDPDPMDFFSHAQLFEQGHVEWQQGLADESAGAWLSRPTRHASTLRRARYRRPRTAANDQDFTWGGCDHLIGSIEHFCHSREYTRCAMGKARGTTVAIG